MSAVSERWFTAQPLARLDALAKPELQRYGSATGASLDAQVADLAPELLATARFLTRNEADARDVAQATLELGLRHLRSLRDPTKLRAWLFAIEAREASRWRRRMRSVLSLDQAVVEVADPPSDARVALKVAIARLPRQERVAVVLHHLAGLSVGETAVAMGVGENTVKTHLRLALKALREALCDRNT